METIEQKRDKIIPADCPPKAADGQPVFEILHETLFKKTYICTVAIDDSDICPKCPFFFGQSVEKN